MRIAVPIWENRVSPVLDTASRLLIIETESQQEAVRSETLLVEQDIHRRCLRIKGLGIDTLICGAVSQSFLRLLMASDIQIIDGISGDSEDVIAAYMEGNLDHSRFIMPGFKNKRFRRRGCARDSGMDPTRSGNQPSSRSLRGTGNRRRGQGYGAKRGVRKSNGECRNARSGNESPKGTGRRRMLK